MNYILLKLSHSVIVDILLMFIVIWKSRNVYLITKAQLWNNYEMCDEFPTENWW